MGIHLQLGKCLRRLTFSAQGTVFVFKDVLFSQKFNEVVVKIKFAKAKLVSVFWEIKPSWFGGQNVLRFQPDWLKHWPS